MSSDFEGLPVELRGMVYDLYDNSARIVTTPIPPNDKIFLPPYAFISQTIRAEFLDLYVGKRGITINLLYDESRYVTMCNLKVNYGIIEYARDITLRFKDEALHLSLIGEYPKGAPDDTTTWYAVWPLPMGHHAIVGKASVVFEAKDGVHNDRLALEIAVAANGYMVSHAPGSRPCLTDGELKNLVALMDYHHHVRLGEYRHWWVEDGIDSGRAADFWDLVEGKKTTVHEYLASTQLL